MALGDLTEQSVTGWFHALQTGDEAAAERLWDRYFHKIVGLARAQLAIDATYDEEDLAVSVFDAMVKLAKEDRYADLASRDELWGLLIVIARRKMVNRARYRSRQRRGGSLKSDPLVDPDHLVSNDPDPELSAIVEDECQHLLNLLDDDDLRMIALLKLEGKTGSEIARQLDVSERTIKRRSVLIRKRWEMELNDTPDTGEDSQ